MAYREGRGGSLQSGLGIFAWGLIGDFPEVRMVGSKGLNMLMKKKP